MPVTIYDVAKRAGVSTATVSKVLSNTPYVSTDTRARVVAVIDELDFVPSLAARSLSNARTNIIGLAFPYVSDYLFDDPHLMTFLRGVDEIVSAREVSILLMTARSGDDAASSLRRLLHVQYVDGAIILGMQSTMPTARALRHQLYPTVALGYASPLGVRNTVHAADREGAAQAANHLVSLGHRRIAVMTGPSEIAAVEERLEGFRSQLATAGITLDADLVVEGDFTQESGYTLAPQLLDHADPPTAVFAVNDRMALGLMAYAQARGLDIPSDLSIVGFDDIPAAAYAHPPLTTVSQPSRAMGHVAAQRLLDLIEEGGDGFDPVVLPTTFVPRSSTSHPRR
jgi:DNA-binding LacI/PurR family transcriptional regulator